MSTLNKPLNGQPDISRISRREFLYYLGGGSLALFTATVCGIVYTSLQVEEVPFDDPGVFELDRHLLDFPLEVPISVNETWPFLTDAGIVVFSGRCTARGCLLKWFYPTERFECPCCGSKYQLDGTWLTGVAPRNLDRFTLWVETPNGILRTPDTDGPVPIDNATRIFVDTTRVIRGESRPR